MKLTGQRQDNLAAFFLKCCISSVIVAICIQSVTSEEPRHSVASSMDRWFITNTTSAQQLITMTRIAGGHIVVAEQLDHFDTVFTFDQAFRFPFLAPMWAPPHKLVLSENGRVAAIRVDEMMMQFSENHRRHRYSNVTIFRCDESTKVWRSNEVLHKNGLEGGDLNGEIAAVANDGNTLWIRSHPLQLGNGSKWKGKAWQRWQIDQPHSQVGLMSSPQLGESVVNIPNWTIQFGTRGVITEAIGKLGDCSLALKRNSQGEMNAVVDGGKQAFHLNAFEEIDVFSIVASDSGECIAAIVREPRSVGYINGYSHVLLAQLDRAQGKYHVTKLFKREDLPPHVFGISDIGAVFLPSLNLLLHVEETLVVAGSNTKESTKCVPYWQVWSQSGHKVKEGLPVGK